LSPHEHAHGTAMMLWCRYHLGDWSDTTPLVDEHIAAVRGTDVFICPFMRGGALISALIAAHLGDFARARELVGEVELTPDEPGWPEALHARVLIALGEAEEGVAAAQRIIDGGRLASLEENEHESVALLEGLQALGEWDRLRAFLPDARRRSASLAILVPVCDRAEGMVAAADGDSERAIELLRRAVEGFERLGVPYEIARTKTLLANELPDGDAMLAEAIATAESLLGKPIEPAPASTAPAATDDSGLSEREQEILALIGEGISNQEIADRLVLSPRTVERHVSNIYVKLGLEGRSARAAAAAHAVKSSLKAGPR
jgi:DNA-binding NarL/FixJ family response regulator